MSLRHSLRLRLLLVLFVVALVPVGTAALLLNRTIKHNFESYNADRTTSDAQVLVEQIDDLIGQSAVVVDANNAVLAGTFGVSTSSSNTSLTAATVPEAGSGFGGVSSGGAAGVAAGGVNTIGAYESVTASGGGEAGVGIGASAGAEADGYLTVQPVIPDSYSIMLPGISEKPFLASLNDALIISVLIAVAGAMVIAALLSRHILKPVVVLTAAAQDMAAGDLDRRVQTTGQDELGVLAGAFNAMADRRTELERLRRNLVNDVAHELRTPLANLQGYLEILRDGVAAPTPEVISTLHDESLLLNRLVADLQELALAEAGELRLTPERLDIGQPITQALEALRPQAEQKAIRLEGNLDEPLPEVRADGARVSQVLRNLLRNAIVHTPVGGSVSIRSRSVPGGVEVSVEDTGCGIAAEHLPFIFDRFYRVDPARARATGGSGLGLAVVRHLIEAQGGRITVESTLGHGSVFTFSLPHA